MTAWEQRHGKDVRFDPGVKGNVVEEAKALQASGYATDPNYAEKPITIAYGPSMA